LQYQSPLWLPGGHLQTIWPALHGRKALKGLHRYARERWHTADQDFIDVDWLKAEGLGIDTKEGERPLLVLFHGLEGNSQSHYAMSFGAYAQGQGWDYAVPHFRGCSGELNWAPRAYHSGDYQEVDWILQKLRTMHRGPLYAVGVSLGGNALLRWAEEAGETANQTVASLCAVCSPIDLAAGGWALGRGINRLIYTPMFLNTMKPKALQKLRQHPGLFDDKTLNSVRTIYDFDNVFTAPLHGFRNADDYWARASAKPQLHAIRVPTLLVHARNDPFVPAWSLPVQQNVSSHVTLWQPHHGGHVGFASAYPPGHLRELPERVGQWMVELNS